MTHTEALKLALEALELAHPRFGIATEKHKQAITAIEEALAQPEQEPVAWMSDVGSVASAHEKKMGYVLESAFTIPLYTTPPQRTWVGLKPEQVQFYAALHRQLEVVYYDATLDTNVITETFNATDFYQQVESELKELNK